MTTTIMMIIDRARHICFICMHLLPKFSAIIDESDERSGEFDHIPGPICVQEKKKREKRN